jgi:DNA polymerase-3 subunit delta'
VAELIGQFYVKRILANVVSSGRIPHAYLFYGPQGTGKMSAAISFSKALNCENVQEGQGCGECASCRKIDDGNHPDIKVIEPDGASIKIEQVRMLIKEIAYRSYEGPWKVFIISHADTATVEAANSVLKVLEEPPERSMLILLSTSIKQMLPTILSRCQLIEFRKVPSPVIEDYIAKKTGIPEGMARPFAWLSNGAPSRALELAMSKDVKTLRDRIIDDIVEIPHRGKLEVLQLASGLAKDKESVDLVIDILISWFRDLLVLSGTRCKDFLVNSDKLDLVEKSIRSFSESSVFGIVSQLQDLKRTIRLTRKSLNIQFAFEVLLLNILGEMDYV